VAQTLSLESVLVSRQRRMKSFSGTMGTIRAELNASVLPRLVHWSSVLLQILDLSAGASSFGQQERARWRLPLCSSSAPLALSFPAFPSRPYQLRFRGAKASAVLFELACSAPAHVSPGCSSFASKWRCRPDQAASGIPHATSIHGLRRLLSSLAPPLLSLVCIPPLAYSFPPATALLLPRSPWCSYSLLLVEETRKGRRASALRSHSGPAPSRWCAAPGL